VVEKRPPVKNTDPGKPVTNSKNHNEIEDNQHERKALSGITNKPQSGQGLAEVLFNS
jgi:hypothetical protein